MATSEREPVARRHDENVFQKLASPIYLRDATNLPTNGERKCAGGEDGLRAEQMASSRAEQSERFVFSLLVGHFYIACI